MVLMALVAPASCGGATGGRGRARSRRAAGESVFAIGSAAAGLLWGAAAAVLFDAAGALSQILMTFAVGGMGAAAAGTLASYLPAFWAYLAAGADPAGRPHLRDGRPRCIWAWA